MRAVKISKRYEDHVILDNVELSFEDGGIYALMGPSGRGKTTLLHILAGLVEPDKGYLEGASDKRFSMVFQEERLCDFLTAAENIAAIQRVASSVAEVNAALAEILPAGCLEQPVSEFSGGMKRRTAIGRAMLAESDILIMDEPFTGLDEATKETVASFVKKYRRGRTLIFSTHYEEDVELFDAVKIHL